MEKPSAPVAKLERRPSLEEPLTLSHKEFNSLREAAIAVINNHTREEATKIFMPALEPAPVTKKASSPLKVLGKRARR